MAKPRTAADDARDLREEIAELRAVNAELLSHLKNGGSRPHRSRTRDIIDGVFVLVLGAVAVKGITWGQEMDRAVQQMATTEQVTDLRERMDAQIGTVKERVDTRIDDLSNSVRLERKSDIADLRNLIYARTGGGP